MGTVPRPGSSGCAFSSLRARALVGGLLSPLWEQHLLIQCAVSPTSGYEPGGPLVECRGDKGWGSNEQTPVWNLQNSPGAVSGAPAPAQSLGLLSIKPFPGDGPTPGLPEHKAFSCHRTGSLQQGLAARGGGGNCPGMTPFWACAQRWGSVGSGRAFRGLEGWGPPWRRRR